MKLESGEEVMVRQCFVRGLHPYHFRSGEWAEIVRVVHMRGRPCYHVRFPIDGKEDYWAISDKSVEYEYCPGKEIE